MQRKATILVVDDDRAVRQALEINLNKAGFEVRLAHDGQQAIDSLHEAPADVVLTDLMMPGMTGLDLLEQVRQRWSDTQVVLMTGHGTVERAGAQSKTDRAFPRHSQTQPQGARSGGQGADFADIVHP